MSQRTGKIMKSKNGTIEQDSDTFPTIEGASHGSTTQSGRTFMVTASEIVDSSQATHDRSVVTKSYAEGSHASADSQEKDEVGPITAQQKQDTGCSVKQDETSDEYLTVTTIEQGEISGSVELLYKMIGITSSLLDIVAFKSSKIKKSCLVPFIRRKLDQDSEQVSMGRPPPIIPLDFQWRMARAQEFVNSREADIIQESRAEK